MIEESLVKVNFAGKDGFFWWIGQIAHKEVWGKVARIDNPGNLTGEGQPFRCKVRIVGYHTFDGAILPDEDLPWAQLMLDPIYGAGNGSVGATDSIVGGETCFGFFLDGEDGQSPVIVGLLYRSDGVKNIIKDKTILEKEKSSRFRPFSGHPNNLITSTQREARIERPYNVPETPPATPSFLKRVEEDLGIGSNLNFNSQVGYFSGIGTTAFDSSISGIGFTNLANINLGISTTVGLNQIPISPLDYEGIVGGLNPVESFYSIAAYASRVPAVVKPSVCNDNFISRIATILQDFVSFTNALDIYKGLYIDSTLNAFVDIANEVENTASQIVGIFRLIVSAIRNSIFKCITWAFRKLVGLIFPPEQQKIALEAMKKIFDRIYCILEKIYPGLIDKLTDYLQGLIEPINAPLCAVEQWVGGVLAELISNIEEVLEPILSGISWLTDQYTSISNYISQASSLASEIYSFLECTGFVCERPSSWSPIYGPSMKERDDWNKMLSNVNAFKGLQTELGTFSDAISQSSLYNGSNSLFASCNEATNNPSQNELINFPLGIRYSQCIPPIVEIIGDGVGAEAVPIVSSQGKVISVEIVKIGSGYTRPPRISIIDRTNYGRGAEAKSRVNSSGQLESVYIISSGSGYCKANYSEIFGNFDILLTSNKSSLTEGDSVDFIVEAFNLPDGTEIQYQVEGIQPELIQESLRGAFSIQNNKARIQLNTIKEVISKKQNSALLTLRLPEYNRSIRVLVNREIDREIIGEQNFVLSSTRERIQEGEEFTIKLETKLVESGTKIPYVFANFPEELITPNKLTGEFEIQDNFAELKIKTNLDVIVDDVLIQLNLPTQNLTLNVLVEDLQTVSIPKEKICIGKIIVERPGYGYTQNDRIVVAGREFKLDLTPRSGAIIGVLQDEPLCDYFEDLPEITINTNTGVGAEVFLSTKLSDEFKLQAGAALSGTPVNRPDELGRIRDKKILNVVDCV